MRIIASYKLRGSEVALLCKVCLPCFGSPGCDVRSVRNDASVCHEAHALSERNKNIGHRPSAAVGAHGISSLSEVCLPQVGAEGESFHSGRGCLEKCRRLGVHCGPFSS